MTNYSSRSVYSMYVEPNDQTGNDECHVTDTSSNMQVAVLSQADFDMRYVAIADSSGASPTVASTGP